MSVALYRKYRPQRFKDVVGQDAVVNILKNSIKDGAVSHAYLFTGSRGTGKTSIARILAQEIGTSPNDLYEIDAASNRGIDDIRALREAVQSLPFESKYKVYIIDEVHMLTKEAFNALLKTLEEPPEHAIFVLATTEFHKLPETIVSRCEVHHFRRPTEHTLKGYLKDVAEKEGYKIDAGAVDLISLLGDGSFRDTLGVLQKIILSIDEKKISTEHVESITGVPKQSFIRSLIESIHKKELDKALTLLQEVNTSEHNTKVLISLLIQNIRYTLLLRFAKDMQESIKEEVGEDMFNFLNNIANEKTTGVSSSLLRSLLIATNTFEYSNIPTLPIELSLIEVLTKE